MGFLSMQACVPVASKPIQTLGLRYCPIDVIVVVRAYRLEPLRQILRGCWLAFSDEALSPGFGILHEYTPSQQSKLIAFIY